jgi:hypothetical protein
VHRITNSQRRSGIPRFRAVAREVPARIDGGCLISRVVFGDGSQSATGDGASSNVTALRESLRDAANDVGCSLNPFAVQVLSAAAGDASRFRNAEVDKARVAAALPVPQWRRRQARNDFLKAMTQEIGTVATGALVKRLDAEDPAYYYNWELARRAGKPLGDTA